MLLTVKVVAVDRSEVVALAAALVVVSYLKLFCPLSSLLHHIMGNMRLTINRL
jgi:hypothetical protein